MADQDLSRAELLQALHSLQERLTIAEENLQAIREGDADALVVSTVTGQKVFTDHPFDHIYRLLVENMKDGAAIVMPDGMIVYCNQSLAALLQQPVEKTISANLYQFVSPEHHPLLTTLLQNSRAGGKAAAECSLITPADVTLPVYISTSSLQLDDLQTRCLIITDLTEQKQHAAIVASEQLARSILEQASEAIIVCDQAGQIILTSHIAHQLCGDHLLYQDFDQILPLQYVPANSGPVKSRTHSGAVSHSTEPTWFSIARVIQGETYYGVEVCFQRQSEPVLNLILNAQPLMVTHPPIRGAIVTLTDITARKQTELALQQARADLELKVMERTAALSQANQDLRQSEAKFRCLSEYAPIGIYLMDRDGQCIYTNPRCQTIAGLTFEQALGYGWSSSIHPDQRDRILARWLTTISQQRPDFNEEIAYLHPDGKLRYARVRFAPIETATGITNYVGTVEDITEQHTIEQMKRDFVSIVSHELRTPLAAIHGSLGLLASGIYDTKLEKRSRMLHIAANQTDRLVRLVNDILSLQRLESGSMVFHPRSCDVASVIQQAVDSLGPIVEPQQIIQLVTPPSLQVWAEPDLIVQTLSNLISNAVKFSHPKSIVSVRATLLQPGQQKLTWPLSPLPVVLFEVIDQGQGIPADQTESIFGWFQQVDASDARAKGGTGLGLAICRNIVLQHGGQIWVESVLGQGSTFYFTLPLPPDEEDPLETTALSSLH